MTELVDLLTPERLPIFFQEMDAQIAKKEIEARQAEAREAAGRISGRMMDFIPGAWQYVESRRQFVGNWHIDVVAEHIEMLHRGEIPGLIVNIPPGHSKSLMCSVMGPSWEWLGDPWLRLQCISHADNLVRRDARAMRTIITSPWYQSMLAAVKDLGGPDVWGLRTDQNQVKLYQNTHGGFRQSLALKAGVTGLRCRRQNLDDPHDVKETLGDPTRVAERMDETADLFDSALYTRLDDDDDQKNPAGRLLIMQRVHDLDMTAHWLASFPEYTHLCFPLRYDSGHPHKSPYDPRTQDGELIWPARYPEEKVVKLEAALQRRGQLAAQGQQLPSPPSGKIFRKEMFDHYDTEPWRLAPSLDELIIACDPNFKQTRAGSFYVAQVWGRKGIHRFLLDRIKGRWDYVEAEERSKTLFLTWPRAFTKLWESTANGPAAMSRMKHLGIDGVTEYKRGSTDKVTHAQVNALPPCSALQVHLPRPEHCPWVTEWIDEVCAFPTEPNDEVDTMAIAFGYWDQGAEDDNPLERARRQLRAIGGM